MGRKWLAVLTLLLIFPGLLFTASCSKKQVKADTGLTGEDGSLIQGRSSGSTGGSGPSAQAGTGNQDDSAAGGTHGRDGGPSSEYGSGAGSTRDSFTNEDVYFSFDSSALSSTAQDVLKRKADFMQSNSGLSVEIEGHCDERGTNEYNMALGDRRARSAKDFMINLGISGSRMSTISYGEEKPAEGGHGEDAWARNRRAHFVMGQ